MKSVHVFSIVLAALLSLPALGQASPSADRSNSTDGNPAASAADHELAAITTRGVMLAAYDQAVRYSTGAVILAQPAQGRIERYIARESTTGWTVDFGRLNPDGTKFLTAYEAVQSDAPTHFAVGQFDPPREDTGFNLTAARAIDLALQDFGPFSRPYAAAVLPAGKQVLVYLYPAQTKDGVYPYGGDVRYLISNDGKTIATKWQMHKAIAEFVSPQPAASPTPAASESAPSSSDAGPTPAAESAPNQSPATSAAEPVSAKAPSTESVSAEAAAGATAGSESSPAQAAASPTPAAGHHTDDSDLPEDTDVFLVLRRDPRIPEYVAAGGHTYKISIDGSIAPNPSDARQTAH